MAFSQDHFHKTSTRLRQLVPDFVESEYPKFVDFLRAYFQFLEQNDDNPTTGTLVEQEGVVTIQTGNTSVIGANTLFDTALTVDEKIKVGSELLTIRTITNATSMTLRSAPNKTYVANSYQLLANVSSRQASGSLRALVNYRDIEQTLPEFAQYFRETYLNGIPEGEMTFDKLIPQILDFYQSRGSEQSYRFLFRALYGEEINFYYPRQDVLRLSDGVWEKPVSIKVDFDSAQIGDAPTFDLADFEAKTIRGLTSNASAVVTRMVETYEAIHHVAELYLDPASITGDFTVGETIVTEPVTNPLRLSALVFGVVTGYTINEGGTNYSPGDPLEISQGLLGGGGYGASAQVKSVAAGAVAGITITDAGDGYYAGLDIDVFSGGTGGTGFAAVVSEVTSGNLVLDDTDGLGTDAGDNLLFVDTDLIPYSAEREAVDYYIVPTITIEPYLTMDLANTSWGGANTLDPLYLVTLQSTIETVTSAVTLLPILVDGIRTAVGEISDIEISSHGRNYQLLPSLSVELPVTSPDSPSANATLIQYVPFSSASIIAFAGSGQIKSIRPLTSGAGYTSAPTVTMLLTGDGSANIVATIGTITRYGGKYIGTRGQPSSDKKMQDLSYYQPFSYVIESERNLSEYQDAVKRLVHPGGSLLLARRTISSDVDMSPEMTNQPSTFSIDAEYSVVDSAANSDYHVMKTMPISGTGPWTIKWSGYISSGTHYWAWRLRKNGSTTLASGPFSSGLDTGQTANVHNYARFSQSVSNAAFGDTITLEMVSSTAGGTPTAGDGQTLYAKEFRITESG